MDNISSAGDDDDDDDGEEEEEIIVEEEEEKMKIASKNFICRKRGTSNNMVNKSERQQQQKQSSSDNEQEAFFHEHFHGSAMKLLNTDDRSGQTIPRKVIENTSKQLRSSFDTWLWYLCHFNLILYGYGSKIALMEQFCEEKLKNYYNYFVFRCYLPDFSLRHSLLTVFNSLHLDSRGATATSAAAGIVQLAKAVAEGVEKLRPQIDVVLVFHCIDRHLPLQSETNQQALATIFTCKRFHLIATTDHRRASALFDRSTVNACNLLWIRATTFENYTREILAGESKIFGFKKKKSKTNHTISSLESVWASLTSKSCDSLLLLVKMVLANKNGAGVQFWDWYRLCRREFFVSSEQALRQHVVEFRDHRIITLKTNAEGDEMVQLEVEQQLIEKFFKDKKIDLHLPEDDDFN
ncbi:Origin recognition complex subunit 2 [Trichinella murrelli]|uniref:Origin recognition complex subunit 2 n=1 Tax=Trichinella murrelli TaxID=144512 RepID=A0A0V0UJH2_9BILA|nr:Origin recognition complex subunit 2 [Trichinella murrelli]